MEDSTAKEITLPKDRGSEVVVKPTTSVDRTIAGMRNAYQRMVPPELAFDDITTTYFKEINCRDCFMTLGHPDTAQRLRINVVKQGESLKFELGFSESNGAPKQIPARFKLGASPFTNADAPKIIAAYQELRALIIEGKI